MPATINTTASNDSDAENLYFDITGAGGGLTNSGTIDAIASNGSTAYQEGRFEYGGTAGGKFARICRVGLTLGR